MSSIVETVKMRRILVSDGAWGTMLLAAGLRPGVCAERWNVENPNAVYTVARRYIDAGSDIITTNSFGGSRYMLEKYGLADHVREYNRAAAALSRRAAGPDKLVMASMGPTGHFLLTGDVTDRDMYEAFREQAMALEEGGADACCIETMSAIDEAVLAIEAVKQNTRLEVISTFTFERELEGRFYSMMGVTPAQAAVAALAAGADVIGTNCSQGPTSMLAIVKEMRAAAPDAPIVVHPNAGLPVHTAEGDRYPETPESMAAAVPGLIAAGATILGGCCGTTPEHIHAIAAVVRREGTA